MKVTDDESYLSGNFLMKVTFLTDAESHLSLSVIKFNAENNKQTYIFSWYSIIIFGSPFRRVPLSDALSPSPGQHLCIRS